VSARTHTFPIAALSLLAGSSLACIGSILPPTPEEEGGVGAGGSGPPTLAPPTGGPQVMVGDVAIEPGRVVAHRLNRVEYNNTVRDLFFGLDLRPADAFPVDNYAEGFDNNAQELRMSNLLFEKYLEAADRTVEAAFAAGSASKGRLVPCELLATEGATCARQVITAFLERAFRRPVTEAELGPFVKLVDLARAQGDSAEVGVRLAMRAALVSPSFLFRIEPDPPAGTTRQLDQYEIASRLSYFLWSSMPDEELFARSKAGTLSAPAELGRQVQRMLGDFRASALVDNLAGQWFYTRQLGELSPDPVVFPPPAFDQNLRAAMKAETHLFLREILLGETSATALLKADFTFANRRLAEHYGLPPSRTLGTELVRVPVTAASHRGGLLTQGSWLTVTSHPDSTSPVKRGKWIMAELLCQEPPPPPPGVDNLAKGPQTGTMRERLAQHSKVEPCRTCHQLMDDLGFALENYDGIGRWREQDEGAAIDASGVLPGTTVRFNNGAELAAALQKDPRFGRCMTRKLLTYALGRGMEEADKPALDLLTARFVQSGHRFRSLVETIATSPLMTSRGGKSEP
jgi:hypothetical protein